MSSESKTSNMSSESKTPNTYLSSMVENDTTLLFTLNNIDTSIANGLRRIVLSEIPTLGFKTFPHDENNATILHNTSRLNNEIIKQRLSCIPIHNIHHDQPFDELEVVVDKTNDTQETIYVTTKDFRIFNTKSNTFLDDDAVQTHFPANTITGDNIILARLRPRISPEIPGEKLQFRATMSLQTAGEDGVYNVTSCCAYTYTPDELKQDTKWQEHYATLEDIDHENIDIIKKDWYCLQAKRIYIPNSFDFKIQSIGVFTNVEIVLKGCQIMIAHIEKLKTNIIDPNTFDEMLSYNAQSTIPNCFDIILKNEGYTLGKVIEYLLHTVFYEENKILTYVGFQKPHPHVDTSLIRMAFKEPIATDTKFQTISGIITSVCDSGIAIYRAIQGEFTAD